jgi:hypothetical protein
MSNEVSKFAGAGLPSVQSLASTLRKIEADVGPSGTVILKMDKAGHWVFGADQTEVEDGSIWAVNPFSFVHGYIAWGDGTVLAEKMAPVSEPLPDVGPAPDGCKRGWEMQIGMSLACTNGEDEGMQARYSVTSVGGKRAVQSLALAIADQAEKNPAKPVPLVELKKEHYQHKSYGRIYTPVFDIVDWKALDADSKSPADAIDADEQADDVVEQAAPVRRRRVAA